MYEIIQDLTSPPLSEFVDIRTEYRFTRDAVGGFRERVFSQSAFSVNAARSIPTTIRELYTYSLFGAHLKKCLISTLICQH